METELRTLRENIGLSQEEVARLSGFSRKTIQRWESGKSPVRKAAVELLRGLSAAKLGDRAERPAFRFIDLFAGIGGMRLGFESIGGHCVFTSEWDKYSQLTYRENFGRDEVIHGDIEKIPSEHIPSHDVLLAGFPCQPFSIAGVSKKNALGRPHGFACEAQGTLFFEVARILNDKRPAAFLLENVKNLVTHDGGRTFRTIMSVLENELGYHVTTKVIDARSFVPQHRERIFIVGFREPTDFSLGPLAVPQASHHPTLRAILHPEDGTERPEPPFTDASGRVNPKYTLSDHLWDYLQRYAAKHRSKGNGFGFGLFGPDDVARTLSARYYKDGSEILVRTAGANPRRLTPRECARLMGFDRAGRAPFRIPVSDTRAYKQFGNAVVVPVVETIARLMQPYLSAAPIASPQLTLPLTVHAA